MMHSEEPLQARQKCKKEARFYAGKNSARRILQTDDFKKRKQLY
jgi:4'-phosphopantetheinyl transferase EntD